MEVGALVIVLVLLLLQVLAMVVIMETEVAMGTVTATDPGVLAVLVGHLAVQVLLLKLKSY